MKIIFQWREDREERWTETEIPKGLTWDEVLKFIIEAAKKAYKYSTVPLPEGVNPRDL
jgi:hypothetical protein